MMKSQSDLFSHISEAFYPKIDEEELKQVNEDDIALLSTSVIEQAVVQMSSTFAKSPMNVLKGSGKVDIKPLNKDNQDNAVFTCAIESDSNGLMGMIFSNITLKLVIIEAYANDNPYFLFLNLDFQWTHTTGGRNGLKPKHMAIFDQNLRMIGAYDDDREANRELKKYNFV